MLRGEAGNQAGELDRLTAWLADDARPEIVHLSNALLLGLARQIRQRVGVPVVCSLQDEDTWVDAMPPDAARRVWALMAERAADVNGFAAVSRAYADKMIERMALPPGRVRVVPLGIDPAGYEPSSLPSDPPVVGYLSRLAASLGLGRLVDAFIRLKQRPGLEGLRLRATGGATADDRPLLRRIDRTLRRAGMRADVEILPEFGRAERLAFLRSLTVLSVPATDGEAFGTYQIEAMACSVPVVQPRAGAFPEIVQATGGGVLYDPAQPDALADALASLLLDPARARMLGAQGRAAVQEKFTIGRMAEDMVGMYRDVKSEAR
jgi:glycosyltransferase involved in cell wall biosynthesis